MEMWKEIIDAGAELAGGTIRTVMRSEFWYGLSVGAAVSGMAVWRKWRSKWSNMKSRRNYYKEEFHKSQESILMMGKTNKNQQIKE